MSRVLTTSAGVLTTASTAGETGGLGHTASWVTPPVNSSCKRELPEQMTLRMLPSPPHSNAHPFKRAPDATKPLQAEDRACAHTLSPPVMPLRSTCCFAAS